MKVEKNVSKEIELDKEDTLLVQTKEEVADIIKSLLDDG